MEKELLKKTKKKDETEKLLNILEIKTLEQKA